MRLKGHLLRVQGLVRGDDGLVAARHEFSHDVSSSRGQLWMLQGQGGHVHIQ
jgi:hypothetical protein